MKMRKIDKIIIHCTASSSRMNNRFKDVVAFHKGSPKKKFWWNNRWELGRGFRDIGYHKYIDPQGVLWNGRPVETIGAHCEGENAHSIGICLGGLDEFRPEQFNTLKAVLINLCANFSLNPLTDVYPHNHFNPQKSCPNFDLREWLEKEFNHGQATATATRTEGEI